MATIKFGIPDYYDIVEVYKLTLPVVLHRIEGPYGFLKTFEGKTTEEVMENFDIWVNGAYENYGVHDSRIEVLKGGGMRKKRSRKLNIMRLAASAC